MIEKLFLIKHLIHWRIE